jgi:UDP-N-acetylmuramoyl-L-alanyl-D-glutamate--2,6-diaminopimelate ligase
MSPSERDGGARFGEDAVEDGGAAALRAVLLAAEPAGPRPLGGLVARLAAAGRLRGPVAIGAGELPVRGIAYDSRRVVADGIFVAVPGAHADGHAFVAQAIAQGAVAVIVERPVADAGAAVQLVVDSSQRALAVVAAWWYDDPGRALGVMGITGTDGKTTTAGMAVAALEAAGIRTGLVSTAEQKIGRLHADSLAHVTTPEAPELQRALRAMVEGGDVAAVIESTSHGLALERVGEIPYDVAILTNLTHEHLEFHGTFDAYRAAKRSLFERLARSSGRAATPPTLPGRRPWPRGGIVNADDAEAAVFEAATREAGARLLTYGAAGRADVRALRVAESPAGLHVDVATPRGRLRLGLPLVGRFNVHNALAVVALGELLDLDAGAVVSGLAGFRGVRGRMERVDRGQPFAVVVDYAHTPAALATALDVLAPLVGDGGGLIAVFGSAGERDIAKRAIQGRIAGERCRLVIATDEDPRGENPAAILEQIAGGAEEAGLRRGDSLLLVADREAAIREAFARARRGDVVLLAGKGHERGILYADHEQPWDERAVALRLLAELGH